MICCKNFGGKKGVLFDFSSSPSTVGLGHTQAMPFNQEEVDINK